MVKTHKFPGCQSGTFKSSDHDDLEGKIGESSLADVDMVTTEKVKEASCKLKVGKSDPICDFSSDCIKEAPDILFSHLATVIRAFLIHGHVSLILLLATLVPIVKDKLGDICSSKNYRSITICSLILKIFGWIVILLFGVTVGLDDLQFAYQAKCSTFMCTWLCIETLSYFLRNNSEIFSCMTKTFNLVKFSFLFKTLIDKNLSVIFIRLLLFMYVNQSVNIRWNNNFSEKFSLSNGVKQGMVLSALFYCIYMSGLFEKLKERRTGCWVNTDYLGILGYSDDNLLLSPSIEGLQDMLNTCEEYAKDQDPSGTSQFWLL